MYNFQFRLVYAFLIVVSVLLDYFLLPVLWSGVFDATSSFASRLFALGMIAINIPLCFGVLLAVSDYQDKNE